MADLVDKRIVESIEPVYDEISVQSDVVKDWADDRKAMFLPLSSDIQKQAKVILAAYPHNFVDLKKRKSGADPFVVAAAQVFDCCVVTEENKSGGPGKVKIPDVCSHYKVECIRLIELLEREELEL